jgi:[protein-PII] uridylyltransferase
VAAPGHAAELALVAVGGYGRGQLFPYSDVDLLVLLPQAADAEATRHLEQFIGMLWDIGLEVGPSVRTVEECIELSVQDVTVQTNLLEARLLAGNRKLFEPLPNGICAFARPPAVLQGETARTGASARALPRHQSRAQPEEVAGGLRDLHTILWIAKAAGIGTSWSALVKREIITLREATAAAKE